MILIKTTRLLLALVASAVPLGIVNSNAVAGEKVSHTVVINSENQPGQTYYKLETPGSIQQLNGRVNGHSVSKNPKYDRVSNGQAQGRVSSGNDAFRVYGGISNLELTNPDAAKVYIE